MTVKCMLGDWLDLTLDGKTSFGDAASSRDGRLEGGRYCLRGPGILELLPDVCRPHARACVISVGIHGNETAPIELLGEVLASLEAGLLTPGAPVLFILGNIPALRAEQRYCHTNLNRLFYRELDSRAEHHAEVGEVQRALELMAALDAFYARHSRPRIHYDLHTAIRDSRYARFAVEPYADTVIEPEQWHWLAAAGLQAVLHQHQHSWTFSHYSKHYHAAQAFTLELGKVQPFGKNELLSLGPMRALLEALIEGREPARTDPAIMAFFVVEHELLRSGDDFSLCFDDATPNFSEFGVGTRLSRDALNGDFIVEDSPLGVVFPNANVEIGARAALLVRRRKAPDTLR